MRGGEHGADPQADQRGRLRPPRFLVAVNFALQSACFRNPPVLLRYVSSSQKIFALQIFFGSPVLLGFPVISRLFFPWRVLGCGGAKRRRTRLCQAHATVPTVTFLAMSEERNHILSCSIFSKLRCKIRICLRQSGDCRK